MAPLTAQCPACHNGRHHSKPGGHAAERWLRSQLKPMVARLHPPLPVNGAGTRNILAECSLGRRPPLVVMAHYDHLGPGYPGADDNASGVACLLRVARRAPNRTARGSRPIWVLLTTAEEDGLLGSNQIVRDGHIPPGSVVVNLDMVGRRDMGLTCDGRMGRSAERKVRKALGRAAGRVADTEVFNKPRWAGRADYAAFLDREAIYPTVLNFTVEDHDRYHTKGDTLSDEFIDTQRIVDLAELLRELARVL